MSKDPYQFGLYEYIAQDQLGQFNKDWFGFVHSTVQPLRSTPYHSVLSYRAGKTMFGLCRTCMEHAAKPNNEEH